MLIKTVTPRRPSTQGIGYSQLLSYYPYGDFTILDKRMQDIIRATKIGGTNGATCLLAAQYNYDPRGNPSLIIITPQHNLRWTVYRASSNHLYAVASSNLGLSGTDYVVYGAGASIATTSEYGGFIYCGRYMCGVGLNDASVAGNEALGLIEAQTWIDNNVSLGTGFRNISVIPINAYTGTYVLCNASEFAASQLASAMESTLYIGGTRLPSSGIRQSYAFIFKSNDNSVSNDFWHPYKSACIAAFPEGGQHPKLERYDLSRTLYFFPSAAITVYSGSFSESIAASVAYASSLTAKGTISETQSASDSYSGLLSAKGTISEAESVSDSYISNATFNSTVTENLTLVDTIGSLAVFFGSVLESGSLSDVYASTVDSAGNFNNSFLETLAASDSYVSVLIAKGTILESGTLSGELTSLWNGYVTLEETSTLNFTVSGSIPSSGGTSGGGGGIRELTINEPYTFMVRMVSDSDHTTGVAGLTLSFDASKAGSGFSPISPTVIDRGSGWYSVTVSAGDINTEGDFILNISATGADAQSVISQVVLDIQDVVLAALQEANLLTVGKFLALK